MKYIDLEPGDLLIKQNLCVMVVMSKTVNVTNDDKRFHNVHITWWQVGKYKNYTSPETGKLLRSYTLYDQIKKSYMLLRGSEEIKL